MQVVVDGLLTRYELTGKGKLVVLLHGWGDNARTFAKLQAGLASHYQVLALDLPGFGGTELPPAAWDLDNYATFIKEALHKLDLKPVCALVGHSNGGAIAIRALASGTLSAQKLVLLAAAGIRAGDGGKRLAWQVLAKTGKAATGWLPRRHRQVLRQKLYGAAGSDLNVVPQLAETFKRIVRQDVQADATALQLPTLLIYASRDQAVPLHDGQRYHKLMANSTLEVIPDAGHFVHHDEPAKVEHLIEDFLQ